MYKRRNVGRAARPSRQWSDLTARFALATAGNSATAMWGLDSPAPAASLTALPPEDVVVMRLVGQFTVVLINTNGNNNLTLAVGVRTQVWTQGTLAGDLDQRWLWLRTFTSTGLTTESELWYPPGNHRLQTTATGVTTQMAGAPGATTIDISPRCKLEAGQALFVAAYVTDTDASYSVASPCMRMLWQTKRR